MLLSTLIFFRLTIRFLFLFHEKYAIAHLPPPSSPHFPFFVDKSKHSDLFWKWSFEIIPS